jgi:hypothetical protein
MTNTPDGLHELEYARHVLEEVLGWPAKGNIEMMGDCLRSIAKSRQLTNKKAHGYIVRAIMLARDQQVKVDHFFFQSGGYTAMKPTRPLNPVPVPTCARCVSTEGFICVDKYTVKRCDHSLAL